ncbi:RHS repeat-associated core domain-containing protein [Chitinophaga sp. OAE865]|uniref:RHS repeat-associated core domain-containing protein n=1 Tax=Chitinophaga sp. OAE865 TaxID=2817898 RepID=UPI00339B7D0F
MLGGVYRYGFNGKENDNEVKGEGNQQDYGMRVYDPRVGRFLSVDPLSAGYPWYTPYQFSGNTPIQAIDRDGAEEELTQLTAALKRKAALQMDNAWTVKLRNTGTITATKPNWAEKVKNWMNSKSPTHTWAVLIRLVYGTANDAKIFYTSAVEGKNSARGLDNAGVTDYKERIGASLNTVGNVTTFALSAEFALTREVKSFNPIEFQSADISWNRTHFYYQSKKLAFMNTAQIKV